MINRIPSQVLDNKSPAEILKRFYPHFRTSNGLTPRVFGCTAFVHIHSQHRDKLDPRAIKCVFLGYSSTQKGYKCYNPSARKFYISADVTFTENKPFFHKSSLQGEISMMEDSPYESFEPLDLPHVSTHGDEEPVSVPASVTHNFPQFPKVYSREKVIPEQNQVQESNSDLGNEITVRSDPPLHTQPGETSTDSTDNLDLDLPIAVRKGTRECTNGPLYPLSHYVSLKHLSPAHKNFIVSLNTTIIPNTVFEALTKREWKDAMREEMSALEKNKTWEIVERPKGKNIVDCKWIFTLKYKADGSLERHKARLVAKGYTQTYGVDYQETFAPVAKMNTVGILLSMAAHYNWQLLQYDVKNAFLHGDLDEEIYMNIPPGFEENTGNKLCKLKKALYELKQSPRASFGRFAKVMKESGYKQSQGDHTLFIKHSAIGGVTALLVYVDDIIVTRNDEREKHKVKQRLATEFEIKELGKLMYFLGIEVAYSTQGIFISQQKYVTDLLVETRKIGCKPVSTPMDPNHKLGEAKEEPMVDKRMY
ncbi:Retrovirus-related Pol polyprotein from transposon TNT 1-94 [Vitis vinifera]|uniref:Retrovirus-related Pol polyprotein from transposon TNT 1-94 n=1 Tax=Vitis vinifera TaxID=29760 RepID=A0A438GR03_VITVI|nr:Retrovirus-related Pol polyprotein from transposon TNT 1-94 [Vitis vinifera]